MLAFAWLLALVLAAGGGDAAQRSYRAHLASASYALDANDVVAARGWLDSAPEELRGWEWRCLRAQLDDSDRVLARSSSKLFDLDASADGEWIACVGAAGDLVLLRPSDPNGARSYHIHDKGLARVRFAPDGQELIATGVDGKVLLVDAGSGAVVRSFAGHEYPVGGAAFCQGGARLATSSYERGEGVVGVVYLWDRATGRRMGRLTGGRKPIVNLSSSPDGTTLAGASWDFCVFTWDVGVPAPEEGEITGGAAQELKLPDEGLYNAMDGVAFSPDGKWIAGSSKDRTARIWHARTGEMVATLRGHSQPVTSVAFSREGTRLYSASRDGTIRAWGVADWKPESLWRGHEGGVASIATLPDAGGVVSVGSDGTIRAWSSSPDPRPPGARGLVRLRHPGSSAYSVSFAPDGTLVTGGHDGFVAVWEGGTLAKRREWRAHEFSSDAAPVSPDGELVATCTWKDPIAKVWRVATGELVRELAHPKGVTFLAFSRDGARLATVCGDGRVRLWSTSDWSEQRSWEAPSSGFTTVAFDDSGRRVLTAGRDGVVRVWRADDGSAVSACQGHRGPVLDAFFAPGGERIYSAGQDGSVREWDAATGAPRRTLRRGDEAVNRLSLSPDGRTLAAGADHGVRLIDLQHAEQLVRLETSTDSIWCLAWSRDGRSLATACFGSDVVVFGDGGAQDAGR